MSSSDYWYERDKENAEKIDRYSQRQAQLVTRWFARATREMDTVIKDYYRKYADENGLSLEQAKAVINDKDSINKLIAEYENLVSRYPDDLVAKQLLDRLYTAKVISREEFLKFQLESISTKLYGEYEKATLSTITKLFEESYYKSMFDYQQYIGFGSSFNRLSVNFILSSTTIAWQSKNYSDRLWGDHRVSLSRYLNRIITTGAIEGKSNQLMTAELQKAMNTSAFKARRLIRTDGSYVANRGSLLSYLENETERYKYLATLDFKTSTVCRELDSKVFYVKDAKTGVNFAPMHPFCRSTSVPYIPDAEFDKLRTRFARDGSGNTYKVPASMTYNEWYSKYVAPYKEELILEQKYKNGNSDVSQWKKYKSVLGSNSPKTFDDFQTIKYSDAVAWAELKKYFRGKSRLLNAG